MSVVETYKVQLVNGPLADVQRWTLRGIPSLLMGGTIIDVRDFEHLRDDFRITHVLNLETEHSDIGKVSCDLCEYPTPDDGQMKASSWFRFAQEFLSIPLQLPDPVVYVHCQVGGSRTPMMVYFLLRRFFRMDPATALALIQTEKPSFGSAPYHVNYIASAEQAIVILPRAI